MSVYSKIDEKITEFSSSLNITAFFYASFVIKLLLSKFYSNPPLIKNQGASMATIENINIPHRIHLFYFGLIGFIIILFVLKYLLNLYRKRYLTVSATKILNVFSILGIILLIAHVIGNDSLASLHFTVTLSLIYGLGIVLLKRNSDASKLWVYILLFALSVTFFIRELLLFVNHNNSVDYFILIFSVFTIIAGVALYYFRISNLKNLVFIVSFLPFLSFLSDEIYLIINQHSIQFLSPGKLYLIFILFFLFVFGYSSWKRKTFKIKIGTIILVLLIGITCFAFYKPIIEQSPDLFELANPANGIMQLLKFGEIPIINALSSHMLSEQYYGYIYFLLNGYDNTCAFLIYKFFNIIIVNIVVFYFFKRIFHSSLKSFLLILLYPFMGIIAFYPLVYISVFLLYKLQKSYSIKTCFELLGYCLLMIIWRLDIGYANLVAVFIFLLWINIWRFNIIYLKNTLKAVSITLLVLLSVFGLCQLIYPETYSNFIQALDYFGASQEHGLPQLASLDRYFLFNYVIVPLAIACIIIYIAVKKRKEYTFLELSIMFLGLLYLINIPRGMVRHTLAATGDWTLSSYSYLTLALFVSYFFPKNVFSVFCISAVIFIIPVKYPLESDNTPLFNNVIKSFEKPALVTKADRKIERVTGKDEFKKNNYGAIETFVNDNLKPDETFIDFSNTPMLYFYLQRPLPSFFDQYMQNTITPYLQRENLKHPLIKQSPLVIFSNVPETWFDNTDGVPNPLRYSITAQYIYDHYKPLAVINNKSIWGIKNRNFKLLKKDSIMMDSIFPIVNYKLGSYPYILANSENQALKVSGLTEFNPDFSKRFRCMRLFINSSEEQTGEIKYFNSDGLRGSFSFTIKAGRNKYIIPLYVQYNFHRKDTKSVEIDIPETSAVLSKEFIYFEPQ